MDLSRKNALVVCGTSSLGLEVIQCFRQRGASVVATGRASSVSVLESITFPISIVELELGSPASIDAAVDHIKSGEKLDFVVFVCGQLMGQSLDEYADEEIDAMFAINVVSQIKLLRRLIGHMNENGRVLFVSSISAMGGSYDPVYAATKAAQIGLMKSLARYHGHTVRFNVIAPGTILDSNMVSEFTEDTLEKHIQETPTGRLNTNREMAKIIVDICGEHWSNLNGQVLGINGGRYV